MEQKNITYRIIDISFKISNNYFEKTSRVIRISKSYRFKTLLKKPSKKCNAWVKTPKKPVFFRAVYNTHPVIETW